MRRRDFISLVGGAAAAPILPLAAHAQEQQPMPVLGFLGTASADLEPANSRPFREGLKQSGFVEGQNVVIETRGSDGHYGRLPALAKELLLRNVSVLVAGGVPATLAAKAATTTTPIVFYVGGDPIELGLVSSLNRPGGNLTGVTNLNTQLEPKRLELLHEAVPAARTMAFLINPANRNAENQRRDMQAAAHTLGLQLHVLHASAERDFDAAFASLVQLRAHGLVIGADGVFVSHRRKLAAMAVRHSVPAIFQFHEFAAAGGLMSYGGSLPDSYRQVGAYAGRILKGEKPADLPVQQVTKVELIINLKTAKALGLTFPLSLLGRADEVIE